MGINGNGNGRPPPRPPGDGRDVRRRRRDSASDSDPEAQNDGRARNNQAANGARRAINQNVSILQMAVRGVRNILSSPITVASIVVSAIAASYTISWLFSASGATSNNLSGGDLPNFGGSPPPPPLNPTQNNGPMPQGGAPPSIPTLEEILANAGYTPEEQAEQPANEPLEQSATQEPQGAAAPQSDQLPPCPDEIAFIFPMTGNQDKPSETRKAINNGEVSKHCSGPPPRIVFQPLAPTGRPRFQCRDPATQTPTTSCNIADSAHACPAGEQLEQCAGPRQGDWANRAAETCIRGEAMQKETLIVLEETHHPQDSGVAATASEAARFDADINRHCHENSEIYTEDAPFTGASDNTRDRVQFNSKPEDVFRRRRRAEYRAQQAQARQTAEQGAQGASAGSANDNAQERAQTSAQPTNRGGAQSTASANDEPQEGAESHNPDGDKTDATKQDDQ
ncbi:MAG: hypothetical protein ACRC9R_07365 [Enterovibrio sp.]